MLQRRFGFPDLRYLGGGSASSVGAINNRNGWSIANRLAFGSGVSYPVGYRENALRLQVTDGAQIAATFSGRGNSVVSQPEISGIGTIDGSSSGLATVLSDIISGLVRSGTSDGIATVNSPTLQGRGIIGAIVSIGFRPSAFDIAQEVWGAIASLNNVIGTMGEKLNSGGGGGGGGGVADWTSIEKAQIRHRLGIDGTKNTPSSSDPNLGIPTVSEIADAVWDELLSGHGISGSAGAILRILTSPDIAIAVRSELALELGRIDTAISSRLASGSYSSPPSASAIATQVRSELAPELARIDVILSTRATQSSVNAIPTNPLLAPDYSPPPSPTAIADAILDAPVGSHSIVGSVAVFLKDILSFAKNAFVIGASK